MPLKSHPATGRAIKNAHAEKGVSPAFFPKRINNTGTSRMATIVRANQCPLSHQNNNANPPMIEATANMRLSP